MLRCSFLGHCDCGENHKDKIITPDCLDSTVKSVSLVHKFGVKMRHSFDFVMCVCCYSICWSILNWEKAAVGMSLEIDLNEHKSTPKM